MKINKILEKQNADGSFSINEKSSPLYSAFILFLLNKINDKDETRQKIAEFLLKEKSANWTFNYWSRDHQKKEELIPDDLFTSSLAWLALYEYNPEIFKAEDFAQITETLTYLEINEGGPYRNWLVAENSDSKWLDVKFASNFLLAEFLKTLEIELENLDNYLNEDRFLASEYLSKNLINFFQKEKIETADYFWEFPNNEKFIIDIDLENTNKAEKAINTETSVMKAEREILLIIKHKINDRLRKAGPEITEAINPLLNYILEKEKAILEIPLLPYFFTKSFNYDFSEKLLVDLGTANLWGWLAYTIYDDFLDDEGNKIQLSAANLALREVAQIFNDLENEFPNKNILETFHEAMDTVDRANTWEVRNCRVNILNNEFTLPEKMPDYQNWQNLHERSIGHGLGPFTLALVSGIEKKSEKFQAIKQFMKSYIIAKQLNDDLNDFTDDLKRGQINSVIAAVLNLWKNKYPQKKLIHTENDWPELMTILAQELLENIVETIKEENQKAKKALNIFQEKENPFLNKVVQELENSADKSLQEQKNNEAFINAYQK